MANIEDVVEVVKDYPDEKPLPPVEEVIAEEPAEEVEESEAEKPENQEVKTLQAQKDHWREKAQKAEKELASLKPKGEDVSDGDAEFKPRVEFLWENRNLNAKEYEHIAAVALRNSGKLDLESLREAKDSEKEYISFLRKKVASSSKSPGSTSASGFSKLEKTSGEIAAMTSEEHRAYEAKVLSEDNQGI